jgi:methionine-rich copper-binding protein CopC
LRYGGVLSNDYTTSTINFCSIVNNNASSGSAIYNYSGSVNATYNWWGSNNNPLSYVYGNVTVTPQLISIVSSVDPLRNAVNVYANKSITITFSEPIKKGNMWIVLTSNNGTVIPITTSIEGNILTITPTNLLTNDTKYSLNLHTGCVTDLAGNLLTLWGSSFSVGPAPKITNINPANGAVNVSNNTIKVTFSELIKNGNNWIILTSSNGTNITVNTSISGNILTITPSTTIVKGTKYTLTFIQVA